MIQSDSYSLPASLPRLCSSRHSSPPRLAQEHDARLHRPSLQQLQPHPPLARFEHRRPPAEDERVEADAVLVDQALLGKRVDQVGAAEDEQVFTRLLLQAGNLLLSAPLHEPGVAPPRRLQGVREDDLRNTVHELRDITGGSLPVACHPLIRLTAEEQRAHLLRLIEREALELLAPDVFMPINLPWLWSLEVTIERYHVPDDYLSHHRAPFVFCFVGTGRSAQRLTDAEKVPLAVLEPSGEFADSTLAWIVPGDFSDTAHSLEPRKVVLLEHHAARSQIIDRRLEVRDFPCHLCVVTRGSATGDEQGEGPASAAVEKSPRPFFNGIKAQFFCVEQPRSLQVLNRKPGRNVTIFEHDYIRHVRGSYPS